MRQGRAPANWGDLRTRMISAAVMVIVGGAAIWAGGLAIGLLAVVLCGLMLWELAMLCDRDPAAGAEAAPLLARGLGLAAGLALALVLLARGEQPWTLPLLIVPPLAGAVLMRRDKTIFALYGLAIMLTCYGFVALREGFGRDEGLRIILWLLSVVIVSDIAGYFAGRALGGPKFWPRISPKKTWSGTLAGWIGAALVGLGFALAGGGWSLVAISPVLAFAGQMGDITESWIKRRAGAKDSSALIPGHGGVLDRFDALIGAVLFLLLIAQVVPLPMTGE